MKKTFLVLISVLYAAPFFAMDSTKGIHYDNADLAKVTTLITKGYADCIIIRGEKQDNYFVNRPVPVFGEIKDETLTLKVPQGKSKKHIEYFLPNLTTIISKSDEKLYLAPRFGNNGWHFEMKKGGSLDIIGRCKPTVLKLILHGQATYDDRHNVSCSSVEAALHGSGNAKITFRQSLEVAMFGTGNLYYQQETGNFSNFPPITMFGPGSGTVVDQESMRYRLLGQ
jgi:hypothetical protein